MRVYLVWANCLVDACTVRWIVIAHGEREAWEKGWDVKRISNAYEVTKYIQQGVKICE